MLVPSKPAAASMVQQVYTDSPPDYDTATDNGAEASQQHKPDVKSPDGPQPLVLTAGPSFVPGVAPPTVYYYMNPVTQERVASFLPPDAPAAICLQTGEHITHTNYGLLGILAAVLWFPLGIGICLLDRHVTCQRCGESLN